MASATPPAGGSQGTGQDLSTGHLPGAVPVALRPRPLAGARHDGAHHGRGARRAAGAARPGPRVRIRFAKHGKVRFTSHCDVARIWERALRRAGIPIAYTEGFSPRPKLSFGLALPTGHESHGEYLDVALREAPEPVAVERLPARLGPVLPAGIDVQSAVSLPAGADSLQQVVTSCTWHIEVGDVTPPDAATAVARALAAPELTLTPRTQGPDRHRRRAARHPRPAPPRSRDRGGRTAARATEIGTALEAELATQPERCARPN